MSKRDKFKKKDISGVITTKWCNVAEDSPWPADISFKDIID